MFIGELNKLWDIYEASRITCAEAYKALKQARDISDVNWEAYRTARDADLKKGEDVKKSPEEVLTCAVCGRVARWPEVRPVGGHEPGSQAPETRCFCQDEEQDRELVVKWDGVLNVSPKGATPSATRLTLEQARVVVAKWDKENYAVCLSPDRVAFIAAYAYQLGRVDEMSAV